MDMDILKPAGDIKSKLPLAGTNFNFSFSVAVLGKVTFPIVTKLIADFKHDELLNLITESNVTNCEELSKYVWEAKLQDYNLDLSSTIAWIERLVISAESEDGHIDHLTFNNGETLQWYFYNLFSSDRQSFNKLVEKLLMKDMKKKNSYTLFNPVFRDGFTRQFPKMISAQQLEAAKAICMPYFKKRGYGGWSGIYSYITSDCIGFFIERAGYIRSTPQINNWDKAEETVGRNLCYDLVFYHIPSGAIWASCQKKDQAHYASLIKEIILLENLTTSNKIGIDFSFISDVDLHPKIASYSSDVIEKLTIHFAHFKSPGEDNTDIFCRSKKKGEDCVSKSHKDFNEKRMIPNSIHTLSFAVKIVGHKAKFDIDLTADKIKYSEGLSIEEVLGVVYGFKVIERLTDV